MSGFEEDLPPAGAVEVAGYAQSVAEQLSEMCKRLHMPGLATLFAAAEREAGRALLRLGPADRPEPITDWGDGPANATQTAALCAEFSMAVVLECERVGLSSVATLFYAAWQTARDLSTQDELA